MQAANPDAAGHPTGGAVDVSLCDANGKEWDMGTKLVDFSQPDKIPTFSNLVTPEQAQGRRLLMGAMTRARFAPFYGEWWHYSYGDREWAWFYGKSAVLYSLVNFTVKPIINPSPAS